MCNSYVISHRYPFLPNFKDKVDHDDNCADDYKQPYYKHRQKYHRKYPVKDFLKLVIAHYCPPVESCATVGGVVGGGVVVISYAP